MTASTNTLQGGPSVRFLAVHWLHRVLHHGQSLTDWQQSGLTEPRQRAQVQPLLYGVLRWHGALQLIVRQYVPAAIHPPQAALALEMALHEVMMLGTPAYAAVAEAVETIKTMGHPRAGRLVNAVLRRALDNRATHETWLREEGWRHTHPSWLMRRLEMAWPQELEAICRANDSQPPLVLRVNLQRITRRAFMDHLAAHGMAAEALPWTHGAVQLADSIPIQEIPGFEAGWFSVQDASSQLGAGWLDLQPGQRVLDACAAPGGKTGAMLEQQPGIELVSVDHDSRRLERLQANLRRLGLASRIHAAPLADLDAWWDGRPFERIWLDAPCSGTGVMRRHPDIRWLRRNNDIRTLVRVQQDLLEICCRLLAPGGRLCYSTCSILPEENERLVEEVIRELPALTAVQTSLPWGRSTGRGRQLLPGEGGMDGFYYALLDRKA